MTGSNPKSQFTEEEIAQASHNLFVSIRRGDGDVVPFWHELARDAWQREDTFRQIELIRNDPKFTAEQDHENWRVERTSSGWRYGPQRNDEARQNPLLVSWDELPFVYRARSLAAFRVIRTLLGLE